MKRIPRVSQFFVVVLAAAAVYGGQETPGVVGVNVAVKQIPSRHDVT
ncbi:MAG: hypothetical protein QOG27_1946, partial [Verrucomicrobiota bacterium]